jgi:predicted ATPase
MLEQVRIVNFRGFEDHTLTFQPTTIIVGRNNAGKSTIVEALRLISLAVSYANSKSYMPRTWTISRYARTAKRLAPTLLNLEINTDSVFYRYGSAPSIISAYFKSGPQVEIRVYPDEIRASFHASGRLPRVSILPQVAPFAKEERVPNAEYVRGALSSVLAPLHFRNQVHLLREYFPTFKKSAEESWPGLRVYRPETLRKSIVETGLSMMVTDGDFTAEIAWMGHGLQMWLQTMWFLARARDHETVILDEPDVYMHADLQRRLVRFVRAKHRQVVIATHSSEIMAEVKPENILVIDRTRPSSKFASSLPAVQKVLTGVGSIHNLQLSRLWNSRRFLMVEGDDIGILKHFQNILFPNSKIPIDTIPSRSIGGWGGWPYAVGSEMFLENAAGEGIVTYCILDSDYHTMEEITERMQDAITRNISLHIWRKKELENYLLVPKTIYRFIGQRVAKNKNSVSLASVSKALEKIAADLLDDTVDAVATCIQARDRKIVVASANKRARELVAARWNDLTERLGIVGGKKALARVAEWSQKNFGVSIGAAQLAGNFSSDEIDPEIKSVLLALEENSCFTVTTQLGI